jgi:hypothetical protein
VPEQAPHPDDAEAASAHEVASLASIRSALDGLGPVPGRRLRYARVSRRSLLIRHEPSDDLLLKASGWTTLWAESCARGKPNGLFVRRALIALGSSALAWNSDGRGSPPRREWTVLARYLRLQVSRLDRRSSEAETPYAEVDAPTPGAKRAARMLEADRFVDVQLGWVLAYAAHRQLDAKATEAFLRKEIGPRFRSRLTAAGIRLRPGQRGRPRGPEQGSTADPERSAADALQQAWSSRKR